MFYVYSRRRLPYIFKVSISKPLVTRMGLSENANSDREKKHKKIKTKEVNTKAAVVAASSAATTLVAAAPVQQRCCVHFLRSLSLSLCIHTHMGIVNYLLFVYSNLFTRSEWAAFSSLFFLSFLFCFVNSKHTVHNSCSKCVCPYSVSVLYTC